MRITKETKRPDRVSRKVLLDTDKLKERLKGLPERIADFNELIDNKIDRTVGRICDLFS